MEENFMFQVGQGIQIGGQIIGKAAHGVAQLAALLRAIMQKQKETGLTSMKQMLKSGNQLEVMTVPKENAAAITKAAKSEKLLFAKQDNKAKSGFTDIVFESKHKEVFNKAVESAGIFKGDFAQSTIKLDKVEKVGFRERLKAARLKAAERNKLKEQTQTISRVKQKNKFKSR